MDIVRTFLAASQTAGTTVEFTVPTSIKPTLDVLLSQWKQHTHATSQPDSMPGAASATFLQCLLGHC